MLSLSLNTPPQAQLEALQDLRAHGSGSSWLHASGSSTCSTSRASTLPVGLSAHMALANSPAVAVLALLLLPSLPLGPRLIQLSESNIRTDLASSDRFSLLSELAVSNSSSVFSPSMASSSPCVVGFGSLLRLLPFWPLLDFSAGPARLLQPIRSRTRHPTRCRGLFRSFPARLLGLSGLLSPSSSARRGDAIRAHPRIAATCLDQGAW